MGCLVPFSEDLPLEEKVKSLADEELLEIWEESQQLEVMISAGFPGASIIGPDFERAIIAELSVRANRKGAKEKPGKHVAF